jgi:hypothetical protein
MVRPGATGLPSETELIRGAVLLEEEPEHAGRRQPTCQRGGLLVRARFPQAVQQAGHGGRVVKGDVRGGPVGQRGGLLVRACFPDAVQQEGHAVRVVEGAMRGGPVGQPVYTRLRQPIQQPDRVVRVVEGGVRGGPVGQQRGGLQDRWVRARRGGWLALCSRRLRAASQTASGYTAIDLDYLKLLNLLAALCRMLQACW